MPNRQVSVALNLDDGFPVSASREAMVAVLRAYGALQRLMEPYFGKFDLTPPPSGSAVSGAFTSVWIF